MLGAIVKAGAKSLAKNKAKSFITGKGKHTKNRPIMEPFLENTWKCPLKKTVLDFIVYEKKQGARIQEFPAGILWRRDIRTLEN